jgi:hypothetical protein
MQWASFRQNWVRFSQNFVHCDYRLRADVVSIPIMPAEKSGLDFVPLGTVLYLPESKRFYIQWDSPFSSSLHYYGPFQGEPAVKLGLRLLESRLQPDERFCNALLNQVEFDLRHRILCIR